MIAAFYEQNMLLYELILDTDPNREPVFATIDQVHELIVNALRPSLSRGLEVAARTDFIDKWRARTSARPALPSHAAATHLLSQPVRRR